MTATNRRFFSMLATAFLVVFGLVNPNIASAEVPPCEVTLTVEDGVTTAKILTAGDCLWQAPAGVTSVEYLVVGAGGGGGGGGSRNAACNLAGTPAALVRFGGGGAGGGGGSVVTGTLAVDPAEVFPITVGAGGAGGAASVCASGYSTAGGNGVDGGNSSIGETVAPGGTGGLGAPDTGAGGASGGSTVTPDDTFVGGTQPLAAQDCPTDTTTGCFAGPGGAGAGADGGNPVLPDGKTDIYMGGGKGGDGVEWYGTFYGGGGGGGNRHCYSQPHDAGVSTSRQGGPGGNGGGGDGSLVGCPNGTGNGNAGTNNLGGGGGGGRGNGSTAINQVNAGSGGSGGTGIVILKYVENNSTLLTYEVSDDLVKTGEQVDFLINGSSTEPQTFYGCWSQSLDGEEEIALAPGSDIWVGGTLTALNETSLPKHYSRSLWFASASEIPTDCSWVTGEPDLLVEWTVLPTNYDCVDVGYLADGESTEVGGVTVTATMNETLNFASVPGSYWMDASNGRDEITFSFDSPVNAIGALTSYNADSVSDVREHIYLEGFDAQTNSVLYRDFDNVDEFDFIYPAAPMTELKVLSGPATPGYSALLNICLLEEAAPPALPEVTGSISKVKLDSASLNWSTVNGENLTSYKVLVNGKLVDTLDAAATSYFLHNLNKNTLYEIQIIPVTEDGDGTGFSLRFHTPNQIQKRIRFDGWKWHLNDSEIAKLKWLINSVPAGSSNVKIQIVGRVKMDRSEPSAKALKLAAARSKVVAARLKKLGLKGKYVLKTDVVNNWFVNSSRVAGVTITYTPPLPQD